MPVSLNPPASQGPLPSLQARKAANLQKDGEIWEDRGLAKQVSHKVV